MAEAKGDHMKSEVYWDMLVYKEWTLYLAATEHGLSCITLPNESFETLANWVDRSIPSVILIHDPVKLAFYIEQLTEYFEGNRTEFTFFLDLHGTFFQKSMWMELAHVPYGVTVSYADLADKIGNPKAVRAVGAANGANPLPFVLPCHRVIGKNGKLTGYRGGLAMKRQLLEMEEVANPLISIAVHAKKDDTTAATLPYDQTNAQIAS